MFRLRLQQIRVLEREQNLLVFEQRYATYFRLYARYAATTLGDRAMRAALNLVAGRAWDLGFQAPELMRSFVESAILLGWSFDTDPLIPWAGSIVKDKLLSALQRATCLHNETQAFVERVAGSKGELAEQAYATFADLCQNVDSSSVMPTSDIILRCWPHRRAEVLSSHRQLETVVGLAAERLGLPPQAWSSLGAATALFGSYFDSDPFVPWLRTDLENPPNERTAQFRRAIVQHIGRFLAWRKDRRNSEGTWGHAIPARLPWAY